MENRFEITDTSPDIPPGLEEKLFEKFNQIDSSISRRYGGTGLGLAISQSLVGLMGGEVHFESEPGHGTKFCFTIVCPAGSAAALQTPGQMQTSQDAAGTAKPLRSCRRRSPGEQADNPPHAGARRPSLQYCP